MMTGSGKRSRNSLAATSFGTPGFLKTSDVKNKLKRRK
jgi:hypothetical protein